MNSPSWSGRIELIHIITALFRIEEAWAGHLLRQLPQALPDERAGFGRLAQSL